MDFCSVLHGLQIAEYSAEAEPYIESLMSFCQKHNQTTFRVMEASDVKRCQRVPCKQVLQEIFDGKFVELKNGMLRYKQ